MRNNLCRLTAFNLFPSFDASGAAGGGGGAAVATPPAAPADPAAPAAAATPGAPAATAKPSGVFGNLAAPTIPLPPEPPKPGAAAPATPPPGTPPNPATPPPPGTPPAAPKFTLDTPFEQPLMGRFKTPKEAEEGLRRSQEEGLRLHDETKALKAAVEKTKADYEARVKQLTAELEIARTTTPFKELGAEALQELRKNDPAAYADYRLAKDAHEREVQSKQQAIERQTAERTRIEGEIRREIAQRDAEMRADPENYPQYVELLPVMQQLADLTKVGDGSPLTGHPWSGEALHLMALGHAYKQALKASKGAGDDAAAAARAKAAADAAALNQPPAGGGGGSGAAGADADKKEHEAWKASVLQHAPKSLFGGVGSGKT